MVEMGILDPTKVTRSALQHAASVAGLIDHHRGDRCRAGRRQDEGHSHGRHGWRHGRRHGWHGRHGHVRPCGPPRLATRHRSKTPLRRGFFLSVAGIRGRSRAYASRNHGACRFHSRTRSLSPAIDPFAFRRVRRGGTKRWADARELMNQHTPPMQRCTTRNAGCRIRPCQP